MEPPKPAIAQAVACGDLASVRRLVNAASTFDDKTKIVNAARKWVEVNPAYACEENPSGTAEWHDVTPITIAAIRGHDDIVEYLLMEGADPTLKGCSKDDIELPNDEHVPLMDMPDLHMNAFDAAGRLNRKIRRCRRTQDLLRMVKPYWKKCVYSGSSAARHKRTVFSSFPLNAEWIVDALGQVPPLKDYPLKAKDYNEDMLDSNYWRTRKLIELEQQNANLMAPPPVQEAPNPNLIESGASGRQRRCFACGELKPEHAYNKNERRRGPRARCISCVATNAGVLDMANAICPVCKTPKVNADNAVCPRCLARMAGEAGKHQQAVKKEGE